MPAPSITLGTIKIGNYTGSNMTRVLVTTMLSIADKVWLASDNSIDLKVIGAEASPGRVQWSAAGSNYPVTVTGDPEYRRMVRIMFFADIPLGTEKDVTIQTGSLATTPFIFHPEILAKLSTSVFQVYTSAYHNTDFVHPPNTPEPQGAVLLDFPIQHINDVILPYGARLIDEYKDPTNALVRRYQLDVRGTGSVHASMWWGTLVLEVPSNSRAVTYYLRFGPSVADTDGANIYPNSNPWIRLHNHIFVGADGGLSYDQTGIWAVITGPQSCIRHATKRVRYSEITNPTADPNWWNSLYRLVDPNEQQPGYGDISEYDFPDGVAPVYKGMLFWNTSTATAYTGAETATHTGLMVEQVWGMSQDWPTYQNFGPLGVVPDLAIARATARTLCRNMEATHYDYNMSQWKSTLSAADPFESESYYSYGPLKDNGRAGSQPDLAWVCRLWPWVSSGFPRMRVIDHAAYMEGFRPIYFREIPDGTSPCPPFALSKHKKYNPSRYTDCFLWGGRPFQIWNAPGAKIPPDCDLLGKTGEIASFQTCYDWSGFSPEHATANTLISYYHLTGDWGAWMLIQDIEQTLLGLYQDRTFGQPRLDECDNLIAPRAFVRSTIMFYQLWAVTNNQECKDRPLLRFRSIVENKWAGYGTNPLPVVRVLDAHGTGDCRSSVGCMNPITEDTHLAYTAWMEAMMPIGLWYIWNVSKDASVYSHLTMFCRSVCMYTFQILPNSISHTETCRQDCGSNPSTYQNGPGLLLPKMIIWRAPGRVDGAPLSQAELADPRAIDYRSEAFLWGMGSIIIGWELAQRENDAAWAQRIVDMIALMPDFYNSNSRERYGDFGFGAYPANNQTEWIGFVKDTYKVRSPATKDLSATFLGTSSMSPVVTFLYKALTASFTGSGDMFGTRLTVSTGGVHYVNFIYGLGVNEDGTAYITQGSGNMAGTVLAILGSGAYYLGFSASFSGTSSWLGTVLRIPSVIAFAASFSGSGDLTGTALGVSRPVGDLYRINGTANRNFNITVVLGDSVLNDSESFKMYAGNDIAIVVSCVNEDGTALDVSSATKIKWILAELSSSTEIAKVLVSKNLGSGIEKTGPSEYTVYLTSTDTKGLSGELYHESELTVGGRVYTTFSGVIAVKRTLIAAS